MADQSSTPPPSDEDIRDLFIVNEMKDSYLNYAMSVIVSRALPDARDGLKPSQRRILYAMRDLNLTPSSGHRKSAKIVGETMGNYHPHGDQAIYPTLVRMAQPWNSRYPLVDSQGNFGSIDGDPPAAMRYTEAKMASFATDLLEDLDKETVDFEPNFDETREEPVVLPTRVPNLLCNGASGIAVGMATSIPPHNLGEVCDALRLLTEHPEATIDEIMEVMPGPDFPTGGVICGKQGIRKAYRTGRGKLTLRGVIEEETRDNGQSPRFIISEIPYGVQKKKIIQGIADCVNNERIDGIRDIRDETDRDGIRIVVELKRDANPDVIRNQLFKHTELEKTVSLIFLALVDQQPEILTIKEMLEQFIDHRKEVIRRRTEYLLKRARKRVHRLEGLVVAVDNLDRVISIIRNAESTDEANQTLRETFSLTERQADAILQMRLRRLTGLERAKIRDRLETERAKIDEYETILGSEEKRIEIIQDEIEEVREEHRDDRRTRFGAPVEGFDMEDLIPEEDNIVLLSRDGYAKRMDLELYSRQHRGGVGIIASKTKEEDYVEHVQVSSTHDYLLLFTDSGQMYWQKIYNIPKLSRTSQGRALINLLDKDRDERVTAAIPVREFDEDRNLFFCTRRGWVKKTDLSAYGRPMKGGIRGIRLEEDDEVVGVVLSSSDDELVLGTRNGRSIRFSETDVSNTGRVTRGVRGIRLTDQDEVVHLSVVDEDTTLLSISERGYGKRTPFDEYPLQNRGGKGVINIKTDERNGQVVSIKQVKDTEDIFLTSKKGMGVRIPVEEIPVQGRNTAGVNVMSMKYDNDRVMSVARIHGEAEDIEDEAEDEAANADAAAGETAGEEQADASTPS